MNSLNQSKETIIKFKDIINHFENNKKQANDNKL